jgi:predicted ABC-type exoprotein transport system permease subunit
MLSSLSLVFVVIVGVCFPLRFVYGSLALNFPFSPWGFVLLFQLAVFMLAGKRYQTNKRRRAPSKNLTTNSELDFWLLALVSLGALFSSSYIGFVMNQENQLQWGFEPLLISTVPIGLGILRYLEIVTHPDMYKDSDATESMLKDKFLIFLVLLFSGVLSYGRYVHG